MAKHHFDLVMCRKTPGLGVGKLCDYCDGRCVVCDSYVDLKRKAKICDECNYGYFSEKCVICGSKGQADAYYCKRCCMLEKDRDGCPKIINIGTSRGDRYYDKKRQKFDVVDNT